jgi:hypothetical protein
VLWLACTRRTWCTHQDFSGGRAVWVWGRLVVAVIENMKGRQPTLRMQELWQRACGVPLRRSLRLSEGKHAAASQRLGKGGQRTCEFSLQPPVWVLSSVHCARGTCVDPEYDGVTRQWGRRVQKACARTWAGLGCTAAAAPSSSKMLNSASRLLLGCMPTRWGIVSTEHSHADETALCPGDTPDQCGWPPCIIGGHHARSKRRRCWRWRKLMARAAKHTKRPVSPVLGATGRAECHRAPACVRHSKRHGLKARLLARCLPFRDTQRAQ